MTESRIAQEMGLDTPMMIFWIKVSFCYFWIISIALPDVEKSLHYSLTEYGES